MFRSSRRLWLLPDIGMDARLLRPQAEYFSNFDSPTLADFTGCENLSLFAAKTVDFWLADKLIDEVVASGYFLGGIGFGGLLAMELAMELQARTIAPAGLLLIGSARSPSNISRRYRMKLGLLSRLPASLGRWRLAEGFRKLALAESMNGAQSRLLQEMAKEVDWPQFCWQVNAQSKWNRNRRDFDASRISIHQLHGRGDRNFRIPSVEDATLLIRGQHLITLSLSGEVNRWIESILRDDDLRQPQCRATT